MSGRRCSCCDRTKPVGAFYRRPAWRNRRGGLDSWCKACRRLDATIRYRHRTRGEGGLVDAAATRGLVGWLLDRGETVPSVAAAAGCHPATIRAVLRGQRRVRRVTARAVRARAEQYRSVAA